MACISVEDVVLFLKKLEEFEDLNFTVRKSMQAATITTVSAGAGGVLGGKTGLILGGLFGAIGSFLLSPDFKSLPEVLDNMSDKDKKKLSKIVIEILLSKGITQLSNYAIANLDKNDVRTIKAAIVKFLESQGYDIVQRN